MLNKLSTCALGLLTLIPLASSASTPDDPARSAIEEQIDSLMTDQKVILFGEGDAKTSDLRRLIYNFYYDQFHNSMDPDAPYFMFMSKGGDLAMGIGGSVRLRGWYDWGGAIPASGFAPYLIPMTKDPLNDRAIGSTPAGTALFFRVIGSNKSLGNYQLYIEANFNGYGARDFHLKKAYATINDWTIGYAASTFSDPAALPTVIDAQGPNAKMSQTAVLVRWMHTMKKNWTIAASLEMPSMSKLATQSVHTRSQYLPDFAAFAQYEWGRSAHLRLAGIVRQLPYRDMLNSKNHTYPGWSLQASTIFHPERNWTVYGAFNGGKGNGSIGGDLLVGNYDLVEDPDRPGRAYAPASWGYYIGVQYNILRNLFVSTTFSQNRYLPSKDVPGSEYKYGLFSATNILWSLTPRIQVGAEFDIGMRADFNHEHRWARRAGAMASFSF